MVQTQGRHDTRTPEQRYQEMRERVSTFTDKLGTTIDPGIFETVVALNLLGLHTFQSCEGHLDHGCPYPWVTIIDDERSRTFNRMWLSVCALEEQAKTSRTVTAYDCYLSADIQLRALLAKWETEDIVFGQITELLDAFYAEQEMQTNPTRLLVKRLHPGTYRIEPGFSFVVKELPDDLKATYLARGQAEMQAFTSSLKRQWERSRNQEETNTPLNPPAEQAMASDREAFSSIICWPGPSHTFGTQSSAGGISGSS